MSSNSNIYSLFSKDFKKYGFYKDIHFVIF